MRWSGTRLICVCGATPSETMRRKVCGIQANGQDGFFEKAGEKGECDGLKCGPLRYAKKRGVSSSWHQLEIMMNGCDWARVGVWDKWERNQKNAFSILQHLRPAYSENCTTAGEIDVVVGEVFRWVKSTSRGSGEIGFSQRREKGHQE